MNNSKFLAFVWGIIPMTIIQYCYWNWLILGLTTGKGLESLDMLFIIPIIVAMIYCVYERFIVYSAISVDITFRDRIPLAVFWILECIVGIVISINTVYNRLPHSDSEGFTGLVTLWCPFTGFEMMVSFVCCRLFLFVKNKEMKYVFLIMLALWFLNIFICSLQEYF